MDRAMLRQRVNYLIEEGGLHPDEKPATKPLLVKLAIAILFMEALNVFTTVYAVMLR